MKKGLLFLLCVSIFVMSIPFTSFALSVPEITSYGFMTVDGKVITTLGGETSVKGYVDVENKNGISNDNLGSLVACCYVDNAVVSTTMLKITVDASTRLKRMETSAINVPTGSTNVVFKVFIMDSLQNIRPVVEMYKWGTNPNSANDGIKYADAINTVSSLDIMKGYEDGSFRAEGNVTRAEFAAIMIRLLNKESLAQNAKGQTPFSDVGEQNWASGYINVVSPLDFMSGYEDKRFGPDNNMTLEQAIKGLVTALGYAPSVGVLGYPLGYIDKANGLGITSNISLLGKDIISRGVLAKLVANSLEVPLCQNNVVQDGITTNTTRKTMLSEYRSLVKLQVLVNEYTGFNSNTNNVNVLILNNYKTKYNSEFPMWSSYTLNAGTSKISELVGRKAIVYVAYDENSSDIPVLVSAISVATQDEITIKADDIESSINMGSYMMVSYWANPITDRATTKITLPMNAKYYINGALAYSTPTLSNFYGSITFVKNDTNTAQDFDTVLITNYTNYVVDYVNKATFRVLSKNAGSISFDPADLTIKSTLYDVTGKQMNWADLKEYDVVSCKIADSASRRVIVGQLVNNKVTGMITEVSNPDTSYAKYVIGGKEYKIDPNIMGQLKLADEGTFYLDILGKICYVKIDVPVPNYAYVMATELGTGIDTRTQVKLFTAKGEIKVFYTTYNVKLDGVSNIPTTELTKSPYYLGDGQFITYDVNANNEITSISRANMTVQGRTGLDGFSLYSATPSSVYAGTSKSLTAGSYSKVYLNDNTLIMVAPYGSTNNSDYKLINANTIVNGQVFESVELFNVNADREVGAVLIHTTPVIAPPTEPPVVEPLTEVFATVTGTSMGMNVNGDTIIKLKTLQGGEATTLNGDVNFTAVPQIGTTIIPTKNAMGEVTSFTTLAVADPYANMVNFYPPVSANVNVRYIYGTVTQRRNSTITTTGGEFAVPSNANVYIYDERSSSTANRVTVGSITDFEASLDPYTGMLVYEPDVSKICTIAREYNGAIIDVMVYIFR